MGKLAILKRKTKYSSTERKNLSCAQPVSYHAQEHSSLRFSKVYTS